LLFDNFKDELELDPSNLILVAEKCLLADQKIRVLKEEIKRLRQDNSLLVEKNEFWKFLQSELTKQNKETIINTNLKDDLLAKNDDNNKFQNKNNKNINIKIKLNKNKIKNTMTNTNNTTNTNEKIFILE